MEEPELPLALLQACLKSFGCPLFTFLEKEEILTNCKINKGIVTKKAYK